MLGRTIRHSPCRRSRMRILFSFTIVGVCMLGVGCGRGYTTIWKEAVPSPDGLWLASAETVQNGGFGSAAIQTTVYLKQAGGSQPPTEILEFWCEGPVLRPYVLDNVANKGGTINLTMTWLTPSHLDITYDGHARLDFQAVKCAGIEISVRDLSKDKANSPGD